MAIQTIKELGEAILEGVRADPSMLPKPALVAWFGPNASLLYIEINKPSPMDRFSVVVGIFHDDDNIRIYTLPASVPKEATKGPDGKLMVGNFEWIVRSASRIILSRISPTYVQESLPNLDALADAMIDEWNVLAEGVTSAELELESVCDYLEGLEPGRYGLSADAVSALAQDLRAGEHHADDEDEDEDEGEEAPDANPKQEPVSPPAALAVGAPAPEAPKPA
jgi:hypothetical protein